MTPRQRAAAEGDKRELLLKLPTRALVRQKGATGDLVTRAYSWRLAMFERQTPISDQRCIMRNRRQSAGSPRRDLPGGKRKKRCDRQDDQIPLTHRRRASHASSSAV